MRVDEERILLVNDILAAIPKWKVVEMKKRGRELYRRYFSTVERITVGTLQVTLLFLS